MRAFVTWYNEEHRHSGIALQTPAMVHGGQAAEVLEARHAVMQVAYAAHPERFVRGKPAICTLPEAVWINPPTAGVLSQQGGTTPDTSRPSVPQGTIARDMNTSGDTL
jgi:hypothetical protein